MANTERLSVLAKVRESKKSVQDLLEDEAITGKDRALLEGLESQLDETEDALILGELTDQIEDLKAASRELGKVSKKMGQSAKKIQRIADGVADAAKALKILADIAAQAAAIV
jgi:ABC-type transporter Mla subunit MlaD